ncbi:Putative uncharacterized protein [Taphrina deformans PYCC 5710]|uniref:PXA domain-containing protein n=1 Tax=Taphrina deformans (strain PYCC 5710 / ATCC 11124 / CBS 356.35 / IMI 108563 / JCM 9778 / NBRC 8474) TaxID=1097556 RepID=R4XIS8_TAPDE|nr:Putative uncharacterized protein [Taphrina deformans PYCC 5710]|eukprot:CCG83273.1 Putative uncharacterized protein [Taphrina deformans PYCC 5710]
MSTMHQQHSGTSEITTEQHVRSWYMNLSQDEELFQQFDELVVHVENTLASRVLAVDWSTVLSHQIPEIVLRHLEDFNLARDRVRTGVTLEQAFKALQDHPATDDQSTYLMHIADALLVVLLPEEHLMSEVAYCFSRELVAELVLKTVIERLSEPWFWDEMILKVSLGIQERASQEAASWQDRARAVVHTVLLKVWSHVSRTSHKSSAVDLPGEEQKPHASRWNFASHREVFLSAYRANGSLYDTVMPSILAELLTPSDWPLLRPLTLSVLLPLLDITYGKHILAVVKCKLSQSISHSSLAKLVGLARNVLFPNNVPSPTRTIPSSTEQMKLHAQVTATLPEGLVIPFFESKVITKILLFTILDLLLGTIFPELRKRSPEQLKEKVAIIRQANSEAQGSGGIRTGRMLARTAPLALLPDATGDRRWTNLQRFESDQEGLEALEAMRRSFEVKRSSHLNEMPRQH